MRIRPILIIFLTVFLMVSGLMNVQAAAKAGSKCQKSGIKAKVGGNNFICAKSGKKLLWKPVNALPAKVVIDVKKTYSTDDGYFDKFTLSRIAPGR